MIVVDANILLYAMVECDATPLTQELKNKDPDWRAPPLLIHEVLNVLVTHERRGMLTLDQCQELLRGATAFMGAAEIAVDAEHAFDVAVRHRITGYDAQYVALAQTLDVILVTEDRKLREAAPGIALSLSEYMASSEVGRQ